MRGKLYDAAPSAGKKNGVNQVRTALISFDMGVYYKKTKIRAPKIRTDNSRTLFDY